LLTASGAIDAPNQKNPALLLCLRPHGAVPWVGEGIVCTGVAFCSWLTFPREAASPCCSLMSRYVFAHRGAEMVSDGTCKLKIIFLKICAMLFNITLIREVLTD